MSAPTAIARQRNRSRPLVAGLRVTHDEMDQLRERAEAYGMSVSNYLRELVLGGDVTRNLTT